MQLIDTHLHLQWEKFDEDRDAVVERALEAGVTRMITLATDLKTSEQVIALAERYAGVYAAVGVHPTDVHKAAARDYYEIADLSRHEKVVAIGEIGMDFYWDTSHAKAQEKAFQLQLEMAADLGLPVAIHNREAGEAILKVLGYVAGALPQGVFHCFAEDEHYARTVLELGFHISFTGNLTYKKSELPEVAEKVPLERLLLETDSPFLTPVPKRGKRNEPAFVRYIAEKHADIRGISLEALAAATTENAERLFGLPELEKEKTAA